MQTLEHVNWLGQQQAPSDQHAVIFHVIQKPNPIINTQYAVINKLL